MPLPRVAPRIVRGRRLQLAGYLCDLRLTHDDDQAATHVHLDERLSGQHDLATLDDCRASAHARRAKP